MAINISQILGCRQQKFIAHTVSAVGLGVIQGNWPHMLTQRSILTALPNQLTLPWLPRQGEQINASTWKWCVRFHLQKQVLWPPWTPSRQVHQLLVLVKQTTSSLCFQQHSLVFLVILWVGWATPLLALPGFTYMAVFVWRISWAEKS